MDLENEVEVGRKGREWGVLGLRGLEEGVEGAVLALEGLSARRTVQQHVRKHIDHPLISLKNID